ncbi:TRAP transporter substrate-binding protein DctP [Alteribacillus iranensis]|uniref:TRAP-type C4-dicarboxylate transport system, substrate-binding protein n=1 Tax=Alteribacillus iranensis TaxID=930128 RepID=A0A1I2EB34_9BACI|nr:TRAP transporter substrate-binding protein DctP [Alteribacillus iranensis]SFE89450.1 TRAP-type C4-dicarboxylate transport system, substrate-binding protein [Alteribacillus iranensis]
MNRKLTIILGVVFLSLLVIAGCGNSSEPSKGEASDESAEKTIQVASFLRTDHAYTRDIVPMWSDMVESEIDNVNIEWIGGPESIPEDNLFSAVQNGIVDVAFFFGSDSRDLVPATESLRLSQLTPAEEREVGYFDFLSEEYEEAGITYLGRWLGGFGYYFWTNNEVNSLADFEGQKIRSNPFYLDIINELGASPVNTSPGEVYTALERNLVDGFAFPLLGPREDGWTEVTSYLIDAEFAEQSAVILMNPDAFAKFTEEDQTKLKEVTAEFEHSMISYFEEANEKEMQAVTDSGVNVIELSDEDNERFHKLVNDVIWQDLEEFLSDEDYKTVQNLLVE